MQERHTVHICPRVHKKKKKKEKVVRGIQVGVCVVRRFMKQSAGDASGESVRSNRRSAGATGYIQRRKRG